MIEGKTSLISDGRFKNTNEGGDPVAVILL